MKKPITPLILKTTFSFEVAKEHTQEIIDCFKPNLLSEKLEVRVDLSKAYFKVEFNKLLGSGFNLGNVNPSLFTRTERLHRDLFFQKTSKYQNHIRYMSQKMSLSFSDMNYYVGHSKKDDVKITVK